MKKDNLIAMSVLSLVFEMDNNDILDVITPLVKYSIFTNTTIDSDIDLNKICQEMCETFGYDDFPELVLKSILKRIIVKEKSVVNRNNNYILLKSFQQEYNEVKDKINLAMRNFETLINALDLHFKAKGKILTIDNIKANLLLYFDDFGLDVSGYNKDYHYEALNSDDSIRFHIASYILDEHIKKSAMFDLIVDLAKGHTISKAIYLYSNLNLLNQGSINLVIYLDTVLILRLLGLKTEPENRSAEEMIKLLPSSVKLRCFSHNFDEVDSILSNYTINRSGNGKNLTLEYFDINRVNKAEVDIYRSTLVSKLNKKKIYVVDKPPIDVEKYVVDEYGLREYIKSKIPTYVQKPQALDNDITSICAIPILRKGHKNSILTKAKYVFVTTNYNLINCSRYFFNQTESTNVAYVLSDIEIATAFWLSNYKSNPDFPKERLIASAQTTTITPTKDFINKLNQKIENYSKPNLKLSDSDLTIITQSFFAQRELFIRCEGSSDKINENTIIKTTTSVVTGNTRYKDIIQESSPEKLEESIKHTNKILTRAKTAAKNWCIILDIFFSIIWIIFLAVGLIEIISKNSLTGIIISSISSIIFIVVNVYKFFDKPTLYKKIKQTLYEKLEKYYYQSIVRKEKKQKNEESNI